MLHSLCNGAGQNPEPGVWPLYMRRRPSRRAPVRRRGSTSTSMTIRAASRAGLWGTWSFTPHNHFHFQNFARYELWTRADYDNWVASNRAQSRAINPGAKTTFCIMNTDLAQPSPSSPSNPGYGSCSPSVQGLSPWAGVTPTGTTSWTSG